MSDQLQQELDNIDGALMVLCKLPWSQSLQSIKNELYSLRADVARRLHVAGLPVTERYAGQLKDEQDDVEQEQFGPNTADE